MLRDNPTISERTSFSSTNVANTTGTIYKTNKTEDGSEVYYYSGNHEKNWVKFGGFCWRIIRTNEDGSVRMLYSGTSHDTTTGYIGNSAFNSNKDDPMYVGYMYGTNGSLTNNRTNANESTIKTTIDTWYKNNLLTNYDKYISKSAIYCNDRSVGYGNYSTSKTASGEFEYASYTRLSTNKIPSYKCGANASNGLFENTQAVGDKFSASTEGGGNGQLKYPIALMTMDEISFAGGVIGINLSSPYAWFYTNSMGNSILYMTSEDYDNYWCTMSPARWYNGKNSYWVIGGNDRPGRPMYASGVGYSGVRPVISLSSFVKIKSGIGTPDSPYEIDEFSCS